MNVLSRSPVTAWGRAYAFRGHGEDIGQPRAGVEPRADRRRREAPSARSAGGPQILEPRPPTRLDVPPGPGDLLEKLRMMLQPVLDPILLGTESDQNTRGLPVPRDQDLLVLGQAKVPREIVLDLRNANATPPGWLPDRATLGLGASRRLRGLGLRFP